MRETKFEINSWHRCRIPENVAAGGKIAGGSSREPCPVSRRAYPGDSEAGGEQVGSHVQWKSLQSRVQRSQSASKLNLDSRSNVYY